MQQLAEGLKCWNLCTGCSNFVTHKQFSGSAWWSGCYSVILVVTDTTDIRKPTLRFTPRDWREPSLFLLLFTSEIEVVFLKQLVLSLMYQVLIIRTCWRCPVQHEVKSVKGALVQTACVEVSIASLGLLLWANPWVLCFTWAHRKSPLCAEDMVHMFPAKFHYCSFW